MKKYNAYIIDDEPLAIKVIENHLSKFEQINILGTSTQPIQAYSQLKSLAVDLLFIDIEMPEINGLELIELLPSSTKIIITTAYREYAVEGFELNVLDYLVKPIPFQRFLKAIDKFLQLQKTTLSSSSDSPTHLFIRANRKTIKIALDDIIYIEGVKDYVKIVLPNRKLLTKSSIGNFYKNLPASEFIRVHKSFVVAKNKILAYTAQDIEIGNMQIPVGKVYRAAFMQCISKNG